VEAERGGLLRKLTEDVLERRIDPYEAAARVVSSNTESNRAG
jgi:hypothetical protein